MRKIAGMLVVFLFLSSFITGFAESDDITFSVRYKYDPVVTGVFDRSSSEWFSNSSSRALLTTCLLGDLMINENYDESLLDLGEALYHSYVGKSSHVLTLVFISNNRIALITYIPLLNQAEFAIWEQTDEIKEDLLEFIAEGALKTACEDGYYKNDVEEMLSTIELLADLFN